MNNIKILYRDADWVDEDELDILRDDGMFNECQPIKYRSQVYKNDLVIGRYSVLPYYQEVENEIKFLGAKLVNSYKQHQYVADCTQYSEDVKDFTPKCFTTWGNLLEGSYIIKGKTNSKKMQWNNMMFCPTADSVKDVAARLLEDSFIGNQGLIVRPYIPLEKLGEGINGLPISNEWRFFCLGDKIVDAGFYWAGMLDSDPLNLPSDAVRLVHKIMNIVKDKCNFYVVDVAKTASGDWICIELNDGQMSGLSCIPPERFYYNLETSFTGIDFKLFTI